MSGAELKILWAIHNTLSCPALDVFFKIVTFLANSGRIWIGVCIVLIACPKTRRAGIEIAVSLSLASILANLVIKPFFGRARPYEIAHYTTIIPHPPGRSFPSGHTVAAFSCAWLIFRLFHRDHPKWSAAALIFACIVAFSRLYLFVHFPSDVLAGAGFGILIAELVYQGARFWFRNKAGSRKTP
ncbi:phosphatase PAP2 family protein [Pseudoramibacter sp.]|jgi:undecaprenyl-diphosphatase|uniref:phosphatase PAP2 family protein n=1 Tax=Pseudoramibacter sp. TaxID=2034862 RepID=UPI0025FE90C8|nr:phosphatase PAP2 family protein [Pseudoramibacter sp.]MCH4071530.1 phosphatase PAP2 family protein [Pseudoramibacter sp.]MCH4105298.1 phosphatase PAP2 family protein [Pseudoramibacter sp.]